MKNNKNTYKKVNQYNLQKVLSKCGWLILEVLKDGYICDATYLKSAWNHPGRKYFVYNTYEQEPKAMDDLAFYTIN